MHLLGVRNPLPVYPKSFIEPDRIHDQRVSLPVADGVSVVAGSEIFGMRPAVHVNQAIGPGARLIDDVYGLGSGEVYELRAARRDELARSAGGLAPRVGLKQVFFTPPVQGPCPILEG